MPLRARISERLGHSGPTVSQTIARMERDGLVVVSGDRHLELTTEGRSRATHVMRKHRLAERLLSDVIGLDWAFVHDEACRWEHVMSEASGGPPARDARNTRPSRRTQPHPRPRRRSVDRRHRLPGRRAQHRRRDRGHRRRRDGVIRPSGRAVQFEPELLHHCGPPGHARSARQCAARGAYVAVRVEGEDSGIELPPRSRSTSTSSAPDPELGMSGFFRSDQGFFTVPLQPRFHLDKVTVPTYTLRVRRHPRGPGPVTGRLEPVSFSIGNDDERMGLHGRRSPPLAVVTRRRRHPLTQTGSAATTRRPRTRRTPRTPPTPPSPVEPCAQRSPPAA